MKKSLVWFRRILRLEDNKIVEEAINSSSEIYFCFLFDKKILSDFQNTKDRRLSFIVNHLEIIDSELKKFGAKLHVLFGSAEEEIINFVTYNKIDQIFTEEDFEPFSILRDSKIEKLLPPDVKFTKILDHLLVHPSKILGSSGDPLKVYTPFMKRFRNYCSELNIPELKYNLEGKVAIDKPDDFDKAKILKQAGYEYIIDELWQPQKAIAEFDLFINTKEKQYHSGRNYLDEQFSSKISPYLRFGSLSIRRVFSISLEYETNPTFVNELIWREFYSYIMYHFPNSIENEFQTKYIGKINWNYSKEVFDKFCNGKTGFPVIDAAIRELLTTGWMHNRARMIVASFFTKNLLMDWRLGEKFFSQHLMDYELASNVGGWQWSSSTGTDAQPYFRIFNPTKQAMDYDPKGEYIKKYIPELSSVDIKDIHDGEKIFKNYALKGYPSPIIDYKSTRELAIKIFKAIE